jgi:FKBP-type peptidyl-prolyl cis-trans isomerase (trigger factor)
MEVTHKIERLTDISQLVSVVLEADDALSLKAEYDRKLVEGSHIEGFRKGKVPIGVVAAKIGRDKYWKDLREYIASEALAEALKKEDIEPVVAPKYEFADWEEVFPNYTRLIYYMASPRGDRALSARRTSATSSLRASSPESS